MHKLMTNRPRHPCLFPRFFAGARGPAHALPWLLALLLILPSVLAGHPAAAASPPALVGERLVLAFSYNPFNEHNWRNAKVTDLNTTLYPSRDLWALPRQTWRVLRAGIDR